MVSARSGVYPEHLRGAASAVRRGERDRGIAFDIVSEARALSGINFEVEGEGLLRWELGIGGPNDHDPVRIEPGHVRIGAEGERPPGMPFVTAAHPDERGMGH
jgi:hypothetical protein